MSVRNVCVRAPRGKTLLADVSFDVARGEILAVVGPTGAGKSTLARVLTGALAAESGHVHIDGRIAFVPQDDALHAGLPLVDAISFAAALRLPDATRAERTERVESVLTELGLIQHAATTIGELSGGQRKRASIAAQLLADPDVMVLDEPTAGLDPGYEKVVMQALRQLADAGRTILIVTHSIDALESCDRALFLAAGGATAFVGTRKQATTHFRQRDFADVFLALDAAPELWLEKWRGSAAARNLWSSGQETSDATTKVATGPAPRGQLAMLLARFARLLTNDRRHLALMALQAPVIGALLWAVLPVNGLVPEPDGEFSSKAGVVVMFIVLSTTWLGVANAIREVVRERAIVTWEAGAGLSPRAYIASKFVALGAIAAAQGGLIAALATMRQGATGAGVVLPVRLEFIAVAAVAGLAATALGLALSAAVRSQDRATALLPVTLVVQLVLAGEWAAETQLPLLHEARWLVGTRWAMEAMAATLNTVGAQFTDAVASLAGLTIAGVTIAVVAMTRAMRSAHAQPSSERVGARVTIGLCATAVVLSLSAGGVGLAALTASPDTDHTNTVSALPTTSPETVAGATVTTPAVVTAPPANSPEVALPAPPVTAAPVARTVTTTPPIAVTPVTAAPVAEPVDATPVTTPSSDYVPSNPDAEPTNVNTSKKTSLQTLLQLFNPFAPHVGK